MSVGASSSSANVAANLERPNEIRQQQLQTHLEMSETTRQVRQQAIDQGMEALKKQAEMVNAVKRAGMQARAGSIEVWA